MCEFVSDIKTRLLQQADELGISKKTAALLAASIDMIVADYYGDRIYIGKGEDAASKMSMRNRSIIRDWKAGERVPLLARRYGITTRRVRQIIAG